jgi:hypothetical protein
MAHVETHPVRMFRAMAQQFGDNQSENKTEWDQLLSPQKVPHLPLAGRLIAIPCLQLVPQDCPAVVQAVVRYPALFPAQALPFPARPV